jgi:hypothetical protein
MSCKPSEIKDPCKIPPEDTNKTGQEMCQKIQEQKAQMLKDAETTAQNTALIADVTAGILLLGGVAATIATGGAAAPVLICLVGAAGVLGPQIADKFKGTAIANNSTIISIKSNFNQSTHIDAIDTCSNVFDTLQENIIEGCDVECIKVLVAAGYDVNKFCEIANVTQINKVSIAFECLLNETLKVLQKSDNDVSAVAFQKALADAKGLLSGSTTNQDSCTNVSTSMTACDYIKMQKCCLNSDNTIQRNLVNAKCSSSVLNVLQKNNKKAQASCQIVSDSEVTQEQSNKTEAKTEQEATAKSEGITMEGLIALAIIFMLFMGGGLSGGLSKNPSTSIISLIIGLLLLVGGIIGIVYYSMQARKTFNRINKPFTLCDAGVSAKGSLQKSNYGDVLKKMESDNSILGYDFWPDKINGKDVDVTKPIDNDTTGAVIFLTGVSDTNCTSDSSPTVTFSHYSPKKNAWVLYISIICTILGLILSIYGGYMYYSKKKLNTSSMSTNPPGSQPSMWSQYFPTNQPPAPSVNSQQPSMWSRYFPTTYSAPSVSV